MSYQIEFKGLNKSFPQKGGGSLKVLTDINLRARQGEFICVIGGSGSGKSTIFNHLLGTIQPTSGEVLLDGQVVDGVGPERGIVPQRYSLYKEQTVLDNLAFGSLLSNVNLAQATLHTPKWWKTRRQAREEAREFLPQLGLDPSDGDKFPYELSGGMRQRVAIGTAVRMKPKVLMMDEPFGALDPEVRSMMQKLILKIWKEQGLTIIFVTHMMEEAVYLGTRVVGLSKFWTEDDGTPGKGATIIMDRQFSEPQPRPVEIMDTPEFHHTCTSIHRLVLDTTRRVARKDFELTHPDAVRPGATPEVVPAAGA